MRAGRASVVLVLAVLLAATGCTGGAGDPPSARAATSSTRAGGSTDLDVAADGRATTVVEIVDGDTLKVTGDTSVRLIGVDTPETRHPDLGVQCYGREASAFLAELLAPGTDVVLVGDVEATDRYGRELAYVYRADDDLFVNLELVAAGYAQVATFPPNVAHTDEFVEAQEDARDAERGLWSACADELDLPPGTGTQPETGPGSDTGTGTGTDPGSSCDPAYPDVCLPSPPPDLDCGDLDVTDVRVLPPDPHGLDGDGDGRGCTG